MKISGQRPIGQNKWQRFQMEFDAAENCDKSKISSKFENGILHVIQPKLIPSASNKDKESAAKEAENTPAAKTQTTTGQKDNANTNTPAKEEPKNNSPKTSEQTEAKTLAEKKLPADESSSYSKPTDDATPTQVYEDFVPSSKLVQEQHSDTLRLDLPGFKKDQLKVQLTSGGILRISGQRPMGENKWQRFQKEFAAAENLDKSKISSKFEKGVLHVIQPKLIPSASKKDKESAAKEAENTPAAKTQTTTSQDEFSKKDNADTNTPAKEEPKNNSPKKDKESAAKEAENTPAAKTQTTTSQKDNADTNTPAKEEPKNKSPKTSEQKEAKSPEEKKLPADESSSYSKPTDDATPTQVYEDIVPSSKLVQEQHSDTLHLDLPGFKKEQVMVQLTKTGMLKISGQRPIGQNKWQRFQMEFAAAENCDKSKISEKFENGILYVKQPKMITSPLKKDNKLAATGAEKPPAAKRKTTTSQHKVSKKDNADIDIPAKEEPKKYSPKTSEQTEAKRRPEKKLPVDESSSSSSSSCSESTDDSSGDEVAVPTQVCEDFMPSSELVQDEHFVTLHLNLPDDSSDDEVAVPTQVYEDFMPSSKLFQDECFDTLHLNLPDDSSDDEVDVPTQVYEDFMPSSKLVQDECFDTLHLNLPDDSSDDEVAVPIQVYEDFMPSSKLFQDEHFDTLHLNLPDDPSDDEVVVPTQVYEDFMPSSELFQEEHFETLHVNLPDYVTDDETIGNASCLAANLKKPRKMMKMALCLQRNEVCKRS